MSVSAGSSATAYSWQRASRSMRSTSTRKVRLADRHVVSRLNKASFAPTSAQHRAALARAPTKWLIGSITAAERGIAPLAGSNVLAIGFALDGIHFGLAHGRGGSTGSIR